MASIVDAVDPIAVKLQADLSTGPYACSSLVQLSGGVANFTYRGLLSTPLTDGTTTVVIKHAEPYIAANKAWALDPIRSHYEQTILEALSPLVATEHENVHVSTPKLYSYNSETATLLISDYPSSLELKKYITAYGVVTAPAQILRLGIVIGKWLKSFHVWASAPEQEELRKEMTKNSKMQNLKYSIYYGRLEDTIQYYPAILEGSRSMFQDIAAQLKKETDAGEGTLIHGDFWTGNVLLKDAPIPPASERLDLLVIDFEISHIGSQAFDIGQFCAELFFLSHFRGIDAGTQLISAFKKGYDSLDRDLACRAALHFGVHLVVWSHRIWPRWGEGKVMESCVRFGLECMTHAWEKDTAWFEGGVLSELFSHIQPSS